MIHNNAIRVYTMCFHTSLITVYTQQTSIVQFMKKERERERWRENSTAGEITNFFPNPPELTQGRWTIYKLWPRKVQCGCIGDGDRLLFQNQFESIWEKNQIITSMFVHAFIHITSEWTSVDMCTGQWAMYTSNMWDKYTDTYYAVCTCKQQK